MVGMIICNRQCGGVVGGPWAVVLVELDAVGCNKMESNAVGCIGMQVAISYKHGGIGWMH